VAAETSVARQFMAGILPGIAVIILIGTYLIITCKKQSDVEKFSWGNVRRVLIKGIPVLSVPVMVLGGIYGGVLTPTEAGAFSAAYCFVMGIILKELNWKNFLQIIRDSTIIVCSTFALVAASAYLSRMITVSQLPQLVVTAFSGATRVEFLITLNLIMLFVGCFFDPAAALLVMVPILLPLSRTVGLSTIHFGMIMTFNCSIGSFTPPFGLNIFMAQNVLHKGMAEVTKAVMPFFFLYLIVLLLINIFPWMSEFIPNLMFK
jgi:C4-dicarboxylate transporter DctM subunit